MSESLPQENNFPPQLPIVPSTPVSSPPVPEVAQDTRAGEIAPSHHVSIKKSAAPRANGNGHKRDPFAITPRVAYKKRPFGERRQERFLTALRELRGNLALACKRARVPYTTMTSYRQANPGFDRTVRDIRAEFGGELVHVSAERALTPEGFQDRHRLLQALLPEEFGDRPQVAIQINTAPTYADGTPIL